MADRTDPRPKAPLCLVLLRVGFTEPASHPAAGALLPHHFTLTAAFACGGGILSVALSRTLRLVGVTDHPVLRSPDFPLAAMQPATIRPTSRLPAPYRQGEGVKRDRVEFRRTQWAAYYLGTDAK